MLRVSCAPLRPIITYLEHAAVHERRPQGGEKEEKESGSFVFSLRDIFCCDKTLMFGSSGEEN